MLRPVSDVAIRYSVARLRASVLGFAFLLACSGGADGPTTADIPPGHVALIVVTGAPTKPVIAGQYVAVSAVTFDRNHDAISGYPVAWTTSDTAVARVIASGTGASILVRNPGTARITAFSDGQQSAFTITVVPIPVASVNLTVPNPALYVGGQIKITATTLDSIGRVLSGRTITWTTSNAAVARVDAAGGVTSVGPGNASIAATSEGRSTSALITVIVRPVSNWSAVTEDWLNYQGNAVHSGYVPATLDPVLFKESWTATPFSGAALNPVVVADGRIFASTATYYGIQVAGVLDAANGGVVWKRDFGQISSVDPPTYANGTMYVATGGQTDSYIWAFSATDGSIRFRTAYANQWSIGYAPVVIGDTLFMAGGYDGGMYAFSTIDGHQRWFQQLNHYDQFTPTVKDGVVYAYTGYYKPKLTAANTTTGAVLFEIPDPKFNFDGWSMNSAPVLGGSNDVIAAQGGRLLSFDLVNKKIGWELTGGYGGQVTIVNDVLYVVKSGQVEAHKEADGSFLWTWVPPTGQVSGAIVATKNLLLVSTQSTVYAIDLAAHVQTWSFPAASGKLAISKTGVLYIAQSSGKLTAISLR